MALDIVDDGLLDECAKKALARFKHVKDMLVNFQEQENNKSVFFEFSNADIESLVRRYAMINYSFKVHSGLKKINIHKIVACVSWLLYSHLSLHQSSKQDKFKFLCWYVRSLFVTAYRRENIKAYGQVVDFTRMGAGKKRLNLLMESLVSLGDEQAVRILYLYFESLTVSQIVLIKPKLLDNNIDLYVNLNRDD